MVSQTNEQALESAIEQYLTGTCLEDIKEIKEDASDYTANEVPFTENHGYQVGYSKDFNAQYAIDEKLFWSFLESTQGKELEKLKNTGADWRRKVIERYDRMAKKYGLLYLLKKGLAVDDAHLSLMYPAPLASSSEQIHNNFKQNIFSSTRQVRYSLENTLEEVDMVLFINGLPFVSMELKNPWTGQTARYHGIKQYKNDRDTRQTLFQFGRCLVHMAVDTDEVYMTTKLAGKATYFLPFNKGHNYGAGNPPNPNGHKSAYLWQEVFSKESVANIIQHFIRLDGSSKTPLNKRTMFFPRYQQLDVVRKIIDHAVNHGVGHTYLIQHSAGSGKSNSITWAAYQLIEASPSNGDLPGVKATDLPLFDSVIVVTDRRILDKQLRENIKEFSEVKNIVAPAYKSAELKEALEQGKKIIITTIQKFPFIIDGIADLSDKRFAVIIDEAHSSQSGSAHDNMNRAMGKAEIENEEGMDAQDKILHAMSSRKMRGNASYFAFTATPKNTTLEKFGVQQPDGSFKPFHLYSMKQAIEEGFILDVIANYTTYKSYYKIQKSIEDNPLFDTKKAQKKLRSFVERNPATIKTKAEIMVDHFIENVVNTKKLKGKARGMVITQNIEAAIRYYQAIKRILEDKGVPFDVLISFSGKKEVDGIEYTESDLNGFNDADTKEYFDVNFKRRSANDPIPKHVEQDKFRLLVVANKYLTGFDQPKLCAMYVDKKLSGVLCVQALSRLNRSAPALGKRTEDLFVLDFFNTIDDIRNAFDDFYTSTSLTEPTDINVLHEIKDALDDQGVYEAHEVEQFVQLYFSDVDAQELSPIIDVAANRFNHELELEDEDKADFKIKAKQFVKIYGQMAAIMPFEIVAWEKLFWFLKFLIPKLKVIDKDKEQIDELLSTVDLSTYGLERVKLNAKIGLDSTETELEPQNPNPRSAHDSEKQEDPLDEIIRQFNERWFQGWSATPEEQRVKIIHIADSIKAHPDFKEKYEDNPDTTNRELAFTKIFEEVMLANRRKELELYKLLNGDESFRAAMKQSLQRFLTK